MLPSEPPAERAPDVLINWSDGEVHDPEEKERLWRQLRDHLIEQLAALRQQRLEADVDLEALEHLEAVEHAFAEALAEVRAILGER